MKLRIISIIAITVISALGAPSNVFSQNRISTAAERCHLSQSYLKNILKARDLHTRVDRLQAYQYIYQRMDIFTRRLERNNQQGATEMRTSLTKLNTSISSFKDNYEDYDAAREAVVNLTNCRTNLAQFQDKLASARDKRVLVNADVVAIQEIMETELVPQLAALRNSLELEGESGE